MTPFHLLKVHHFSVTHRLVTINFNTWASWGRLVVVHCEDGIHVTQSLSKVPPPRANNDELEDQFPTQTFWESNG